MSDLGAVLALWQEASHSGEDYVLATVVAVEGSSYRKPGARMLITKSGRRTGTISGGCLEAEVSAKAWWHTENGPIVNRYSTSFDVDDDAPPYGMGCGGVVYILLERKETAETLLQALSIAFQQRLPLGVTTVLDGPAKGTRIFAEQSIEASEVLSSAQAHRLSGLAAQAIEEHRSIGLLTDDEAGIRVFVEYVVARPGLFIFGAGDDVRPLVTQARTLDWFISVLDGRSHLATRERFPEADAVTVMKTKELPSLRETDAAVLMTHSYEQDLFLLTKLLSTPLGYLGILGPRHRTHYILSQISEQTGGSKEELMSRLHSPTGLDLGADSPASIALSIIAEIQAELSHSAGGHLRDVKRQSSVEPYIDRLQRA